LKNINKEIIKLLFKNPTKTFQWISQQVKVSTSTVARKYEEMKNENIIFSSTYITDFNKIGFNGKAFLFIHGTKNFNPANTMYKLGKIPNIFIVTSIFGGFDVLAMMMFRDIFEISSTVNKIKSFSGIKNVKVAITEDTQYPFKKEYANMNINDEFFKDI